MDGEAPGNTPTTADLLNFADVADIDDFIEGLRKYEAGEWTADQFRAHRLARGTYGQRQTDVNMLRVKLPAGVVDAPGLEALADIAEKFAPKGIGHLTTRQNVQYHFVKLSEAAAAMARLAEAGITMREACGNTVRNVTACPRAGTCKTESFDVTPYAHAVARHFLRRPENQALPRKFKIAFSGCGDDCAMGAINDVGLTAMVKDGTRGFRMVVAGGLSTTPEDAHELYAWIPADELIPAMEAVVAVFDKHGNRQNRSRARLKYVVRKAGWDGFRTLYETELAAVHARGHVKHPIDAAEGADGQHALARPKVRRLPVLQAAAAGAPPGWTAWRKTNVLEQKQAGLYTVVVRLRRGDLTAAQFRALADIVRRFGDGTTRLTIDQNFMLRNVPRELLEDTYIALGAAGLGEANAGTISDVTSCPGAESCNLAVTSSRELASALTDTLEAARESGAPGVAAAQDVDIKISGCPNSCGQHHIAGIGFHGGMRRVGGKVVPEYTLHLGGGIDGGGATFGRTPIKIPARRTPAALLRLLALYDREKQPGERARDFFRRVDEAVVKAAVADLTKMDDAAPEEFLDLGMTESFEVKTGPGECAA